jgi:hypothetical protein
VKTLKMTRMKEVYDLEMYKVYIPLRGEERRRE